MSEGKAMERIGIMTGCVPVIDGKVSVEVVDINKLQAELAALRAENARLVEALGHIRDFSVMGIGLEAPGAYAKNVARDALAAVKASKGV